MNFGKSFTYIFDDPQWFDKLLIPILVSLIPLVGSFAVLGYILRTIANVARGEAYPLPPRFSLGGKIWAEASVIFSCNWFGVFRL